MEEKSAAQAKAQMMSGRRVINGKTSTKATSESPKMLILDRMQRSVRRERPLNQWKMRRLRRPKEKTASEAV